MSVYLRVRYIIVRVNVHRKKNIIYLKNGFFLFYHQKVNKEKIPFSEIYQFSGSSRTK